MGTRECSADVLRTAVIIDLTENKDTGIQSALNETKDSRHDILVLIL